MGALHEVADIAGPEIPAVQVAGTGGEEIRAGTVFPRLEINAEIAVVFAFNLIDGIIHQRLRGGRVVLLEHLQNLRLRIRGGIEHQGVELRIRHDRVDAALQFGIVAGMLHADFADQPGQRDRIEIFRVIEEEAATGLRSEVRAVQHFDDLVEAHTVFDRKEAVLFRRNQQHSGTVLILDRLNLGHAGVHPARTDCRHHIGTDFIRIGMLELVDLRVDIRVVVRVDESDLFGLPADLNVQLRLHLSCQRRRRRHINRSGRQTGPDCSAKGDKKGF